MIDLFLKRPHHRLSAPKRVRVAIYLATLVVFFGNAPAARAIETHGSCTSQGDWTRQALEQSHAIASAINQLANDPNCKALVGMLEAVNTANSAFMVPKGEAGRQATRMETIPGELRAFYSYLRTGGPLGERVSRAMASTALEAASTPMGSSTEALSSLQTRTADAANYGVSLLDQVMVALPQNQLCMNGNPSAVGTIFGAAVQMAGAFVSGGEGVTSRVGNTISNFVKFLRDRKYAKMLRTINESEYWTAISCLLESTSQAYCSANEAYQLLNFQRSQEEYARDQRDSAEPGGSSAASANSDPLEGYYLMVRELPIVSAWLEKVRFGMTPRVSNDADYKNATLDQVNDLLKAVNGLKGMYSEELKIYETLPNVDAKKNYALTMLKGLSASIITNSANGYGFHAGGAPTKAGVRNFFTTKKVAEMIPYYMLGMDKMPEETAVNRPGSIAMSFDQWIVNGGQLRPEFFANPDLLVRQLEVRLDHLIEGALLNGSVYFQDRMNPDPQNLVTEAVASPSISVIESLKNVKKYLKDLQGRVQRDPENGGEILLNITDTIYRIDRVLRSFEDIKKRIPTIMRAYAMVTDLENCVRANDTPKAISEIEELLGKLETIPGQEEKSDSTVKAGDQLKRRINQVYQDAVRSAYDEFNVMLQKDGFLSTRVSSFVKFDYSDRIRHKANMSPYQRQIMVMAGKRIMDEFSRVNLLNPVLAEQDLNAAQVVNSRNLAAVQDLVSDSLFEAIEKINRTSAGGNVTGHDLLGFPYYHTVKPTRDDNGSFEQFRSKLCVQSLAFKDWKKFSRICEGSALKSRFQPADDGADLNMSYDEMAKKKASASDTAQYTCALRNYIQQNQVYWLTKKFK